MTRPRSFAPAIACLLAVLVFAGAAPKAGAYEGASGDPVSIFDGERMGKASAPVDGLGISRLTEEPVGSATGRGFNPTGTVARAFQVNCPDDPDHWICNAAPVEVTEVVEPPEPVDPKIAEALAFDRAHADAVEWLNEQQLGFNTAPPPRGQVVNLRNFMWVHGPWEPKTMPSETEDDIDVTITVTPVKSLWRLEETLSNRTFEYVCDGPGHQYAGDPDVVSACGHTFDHSSSVVGDVVLTIAVIYELTVVSTLEDSLSNYTDGQVVQPAAGVGTSIDLGNTQDAISEGFQFPLWVNEVLTWGFDEDANFSSPEYDTGPIVPKEDGYSCSIGENIAFYGATGGVGGLALNAFGIGCGDAFEVLHILADGVVACVGGIANSIGQTIELLVGAVTDPVGTVKEGVAGIQALIQMAKDNPAEFGSTVALGALGIDKAEWDAAAGDVGAQAELAIAGICGVAFEIIAGGAAKRLFNLLPIGTRPGGTPEGPRRPRVCLLSSFPNGTPVRMASGELLPIERVQPGDYVLAADPATGQWSNQLVLDQWSYLDVDHMTTATLADGSTISATDHHLFWVDSDQEWVELQHVAAGDDLLTPNGITTVAEVVTHPQAETLVWELDAAGPDTFTVHTGTADVLVHNAKRCELSNSEIKHILDGNADGGFHFREGGVDPDGSTFIKKRPPSKLKMDPNSPWQDSGVYKGKVEIDGDLDLDGNQRSKDSTFFPDSWDRQDVIDAVETAMPEKVLLEVNERGKVFRGFSENGLPIKIIEDLDGNLVTAFPDVEWAP